MTKVFTQKNNSKFHGTQPFAVQSSRPAWIYRAARVDIIARHLAGLKMRVFKTEDGRRLAARDRATIPPISRCRCEMDGAPGRCRDRLAFMKFFVLGLALCLPLGAVGQSFSVSFPKDVSAQALDGRLLLVLSTDPSDEPRNQIDDTPRSQMVFGLTVDGWRPGQATVVDAGAWGYPVRSLKDVPPGEYSVQAVLNKYATFHRSDGKTVKLHTDQGEGQQWNSSPGNLYSKPQKVTVKAGGAPIAISLTEVIPPIAAPADTKYVRHIRIQSEVLTKFWGRPMFLSAIVLVPEGFDEHPDARFPLMIFHDHFATDFSDFPHDAAGPESEARLQRAVPPGGVQPDSAGGGVQVLSEVDCAGVSALSGGEDSTCESVL